MASKKVNKITLVLAYAALEMILIVLLFINGFFSYVIGKFADRFRLKKPCLWCSRIDHVFEAGKVNDCRSLFCEAHSVEISRLRYCFDHGRLAEPNAMCGGCYLSEKQSDDNGVYSWVSDEEFGAGFRLICSCCGTNLEKKAPLLDCEENPSVAEEKGAIFTGEGDESPRPHLEFLIDTNGRHLIPLEPMGENPDEAPEAETKYELIAEEEGDLEEEVPLLNLPEKNEDDVSVKDGIVAVSRNEGEEAVPDTPTSIESFNQIQKKLLTLERRESWAESVDGSMISEVDAGDLPGTIEKLKAALKTERKALRSLYEELEEERNASAVAANQTMAMINRLQEEKAAMQMEALHYQRMMDEQTEYDQEALQLLNELMRKREREKEELERELEFYRKRVEGHEGESELYLESFETERQSILQQVKTLESKIGGVSVSPRKLLPIFDSVEGEEGSVNGLENGHGFEVEEEVGHVYERLHALEEDREFLKHCMLSLTKGGKGVELLEEILHHLRDLRSVQTLV